MRVLGAVYCVAAVVAVASYLAAGPSHMHVDGWKVTKPRVDVHCVVIELDNRKDRHILDHAWDATDKGVPRHLHIDREGAEENRRESLAGIPTWGHLSKQKRLRLDKVHWNVPHDRDEWAPAMSREGGRGADVRYVLSIENRSAGSEMGRQLRGYPDGTCFQMESRP